MATRSFKSLNVDEGSAANAVRNCSTIAELHAVLPLSFRPALSEYLTRIYRLATKAGNVSNTIAQYEKHSTNGTFPPFITNTIKVPKIQFSNEYDGSPEGLKVSQALADIVTKARKSYLSEALKRKKQEQTLLLQSLAYKESEWQKVVEETTTRVVAVMGATFSKGANPREAWNWSGASVPESTTHESQALWLNGNVYHAKAIGIARAVADKALLQRMKNVTLKEEAAVDKMDVDSKDQSVNTTIEEALKKFEQKLISGAITVKTKTTARQNGGAKKGQKPGGGKNKGRVNKSPPKKQQKKQRK